MLQRPSPFVKLGRWLLPPLMLLVGLGGMMALGTRRPEPSAARLVEQTPLVSTAPAESFDGRFDIEADGVVVAYRDIDVPAEVSGLIVEKNPECRAGNVVSEGTVLYRIDPRDYQLEVSRLTFERDQADVMLAELETELEGTRKLAALAREDRVLAERELERKRRLQGGAVTESEVDRARQAVLTAQQSELNADNLTAVLETRRERLRFARELSATQLEKAKLDLSRTTIIAPVGGMVARDWVEQGDYVQKGATLSTIEDTARAEVKCSLLMEELYWLWGRPTSADARLTTSDLGGLMRLQPAEATVVFQLGGPGGLEYAWDGMLARFDGSGLDEQTRTVACRVVVDDPGKVRVQSMLPGSDLLPRPPSLARGMYVSVKIHVEPRTGLLRIPESALRPGKKVWRVRGTTIEVVPRVEVVRQLGGNAGSHVLVDAIRSGLVPGDQLVVSSLPYATEGMTVRIDSDADGERPLP